MDSYGDDALYVNDEGNGRQKTSTGMRNIVLIKGADVVTYSENESNRR